MPATQLGRDCSPHEPTRNVDTANFLPRDNDTPWDIPEILERMLIVLPKKEDTGFGDTRATQPAPGLHGIPLAQSRTFAWL
jgi:hypothetical protein